MKIMPILKDKDAGDNITDWTSKVSKYEYLKDDKSKIRLHLEQKLPYDNTRTWGKRFILGLRGGGIGGVWLINDRFQDGFVVVCSHRNNMNDGTGDCEFKWEAEFVSHEHNLCVKEKTTSSNLTENDESTITAFIPLPLSFLCRASIFNIIAVDTVDQKFQVDLYIEMRLREISQSPNQELVEEFISCYGFNSNSVEFLNVSEIVGEVQRSTAFTAASLNQSKFDYVFKFRIRAIFNEEMELHKFPFDEQDLNIPLTVTIPNEFIVLKANTEFPSVFYLESFQLINVFSVVSGGIVLSEPYLSKPNESTAGLIYPRINFQLLLERKGEYYVTNVAIPTTVITYLSFLSFGILKDNTRMDTNDRLGITLTCLLTAVAYKFVVASSIPQVSYFTLLDKYVCFCNIVICLIAVENAVYPLVGGPSTPAFENLICCGFLLIFTSANIGWYISVYSELSLRKKNTTNLYEIERIRRLIAKTYFSLPSTARENILTKILAKKGIDSSKLQQASAEIKTKKAALESHQKFLHLKEKEELDKKLMKEIVVDNKML